MVITHEAVGRFTGECGQYHKAKILQHLAQCQGGPVPPAGIDRLRIDSRPEQHLHT